MARFMDLGNQPNGNRFVTPGEEREEERFPLSMLVCETCWQVQIDEFPPREFLFADHPYVTGVNVPVVEHFKKLVAHVVNKLDLAKGSLVVDIGCNDGTLLKEFMQQGMRGFGIDPGYTTGEIAKENGILVARTFWDDDTGKAIAALNMGVDVFTATAVFYHVADLHDFVSGLERAMGENTVFVVQCVSLEALLKSNQFDHFYHEHSCIHSIKPLKRLFEEHGLRCFSVDSVEIHGGSFVLFVCRQDAKWEDDGSVGEAIEREDRNGLGQLSTYQKFVSRVDENVENLVGLLTTLNEEGKTVYGLGAPVKGNTLLNYAKIGPDLVEVITEVNVHKVGKLAPGTHIPIVHESEIDSQPDYYLVLSWNFLDFFVAKYKQYLLDGGKFIVPVPTVRVLGFESVKGK